MINVPSEWVKTEQTLPDRRKIILYFKPESNQKTLMFIAYTPTRDDFTSLGSFGVRLIAMLLVLLYSKRKVKYPTHTHFFRQNSL